MSTLDRSDGHGRELQRTPPWTRPDQRYFTTLDAKFEVFLEESFFRESWDDVVQVWGDNSLAHLQRLAVLVFKPEAIVSRRLDEILDYVGEHGFRPLCMRQLRLTELIMREIWRYQWNIATTERIAVATSLYSSLDTLFVVLDDTTPSARLPGSVRLRSLKGHAIPERRREGELRTVLGGSNPMLTFVHIPDEPADLVREFAVCFDRHDRIQLLVDLQQALAGRLRPVALSAEVEELYARAPIHDLSSEGAISHIRAAVAHRRGAEGSTNKAALNKVESCLDGCMEGRFLDWRALVDAITAARIVVDAWDVIVLGTQYIQHDIPQRVALIDGDGREGWLCGHGMRA